MKGIGMSSGSLLAPRKEIVSEGEHSSSDFLVL
jgi:hypothetical protein